MDVFGRLPPELAGAYSADATVVAFTAGPDLQPVAGFVTQQIHMQYEQKFFVLRELGSRSVFYVSGPAHGSGEITRILGPRPVALAFYRAYGNVCNAPRNNLFFAVTAGCHAPGDLNLGLGLLLTGVFVPKLSIQASVENNLVVEQMQVNFVSMLG